MPVVRKGEIIRSIFAEWRIQPATASYSQLGFREFPDAFELMLAYWLREAMLEGETFEVDEAVCRERGLTTEQIGNLRQAFDECRDKLLDEFLCEARRYRLIVKRYRP